MFQLGNRFGVKKPKPVIPASPLVNAGTQENLDRVIKSLEAKRAELTEVRSRLATLDQTIGEHIADGLDASAAVHARQDALARAVQLEAAVEVLTRRWEDAQRALTDTIRAETAAKEREACARVLELGEDGERILASVKQWCEDMNAAVTALGAINDKYAYPSTEIRMQFALFLSLAKHPLTRNAHVLETFKKYQSFTECLTANCGSRVSDGRT